MQIYRNDLKKCLISFSSIGIIVGKHSPVLYPLALILIIVVTNILLHFVVGFLFLLMPAAVTPSALLNFILHLSKVFFSSVKGFVFLTRLKINFNDSFELYCCRRQTEFC